MGDLLNNTEMFKKLGFDNSNQWIFYDEHWQELFRFVSKNISDANILTAQEVLERDEVLSNCEWLPKSARGQSLQQLESENPGLLNYKSQHIDGIMEDIIINEEVTNDYAVLTEEMVNTKRTITKTVSELDYAVANLHVTYKEFLRDGQAKAKQLENLELKNSSLSVEAKKMFTNFQLPPYFMHQMALEQYFLKCDSFMQYFTFYIKNIYKIQENVQFEQQDDNKFELLQRSIQYYMFAQLSEMADVAGTQALTSLSDVDRIHCINLVNMASETQKLQLHNDDHLKNAYETLLDVLLKHVQYHSQQLIDLILYENTELKLERAIYRRENNRNLTKILCNGLSNAEVIWIAIQMDLEKKRSFIDCTKVLCEQVQASWDRIVKMRYLNTSQNGIYDEFLCKIANELSDYFKHSVCFQTKSCVYQYKKFYRLMTYAFQSMLKKNYLAVYDQLTELSCLEQMLRPFVYDSPLEHPMFRNVRYLCTIFNMSMANNSMEEKLRHLRTQFLWKVIEKMDKDKLWRCGKLLWIWFITEPHRVYHAIDEAKKASAKVPALCGNILRPGGLQRK